MFPVGQFSYPFQFQLPPDLSSCFKASGGEKGRDSFKCKSSYKLYAYADLPYCHNLAAKTKMIINEKFDKMVQPSYAHNSKGFLLASGKLDCQCWLDKNAYFPGERVMAKMEANNTSTKKTRRIMMDIYINITINAKKQTKKVSTRVHRSEFPGFDPCFYGIRYLPFNAPPDLQPSCDGKLIKADYVMILGCDIPNAIDLELKLPIKLLAPQFLFATTMPHPEFLPPPPNEDYRPPWQADAKNCQLCGKSFGLLNRSHHCRHCHNIVCEKCSKTSMALPNLGYSEPVRVCDKCVPSAKEGGVRYLAVKGDPAQVQTAQMNATAVVGNREGWGYIENNGFVIEVREVDDHSFCFLNAKMVPPMDSQLFRVEGKIITSKLNGKCIDVRGGNKRPGTEVICWKRHGNSNQQWTYTNQSFKSGLSGVLSGNLVIDTQSGMLQVNDKIIINKANGKASQKFLFKRL